MIENKDVYSLEDARRRKTEEALNEVRKTITDDEKFVFYLRGHLDIVHLNNLFKILHHKKDFQKINRINELLKRIYTAKFIGSGLRRRESVVDMQNESREIVVGRCFNEVDRMMREEGAKIHNP